MSQEEASNSEASLWQRSLALHNFRRITTGGQLIPELDGLRLLAILLVLHEHTIQVLVTCGSGLPHVLAFFFVGTKGVQLFFTISGFILGLPFAKRALLHSTKGTNKYQTRYGTYLLRRVTRLEPPYILSLLLRTLLLLLVMHKSWQAIASHLGATILYLHGSIYGYRSTISPPTWSLEVEVQFYLIAPFLAAIFYLRNAWLRRSVLLTVMILQPWLTRNAFYLAPHVWYSLLAFIGSFLAGFLLCDLYVSETFAGSIQWLWDLAVIPLILAVLVLPDLTWMTLMPLLTLGLTLAVFRGSAARNFFALPLVSILGGMCYSTYLMQGLAMTATLTLLHVFRMESFKLTHPHLVNWLLYPDAIFAAFVIGAIYFRLIERPCMEKDWPQRLTKWVSRLGTA